MIDTIQNIRESALRIKEIVRQQEQIEVSLRRNTPLNNILMQRMDRSNFEWGTDYKIFDNITQGKLWIKEHPNYFLRKSKIAKPQVLELQEIRNKGISNNKEVRESQEIKQNGLRAEDLI